MRAIGRAGVLAGAALAGMAGCSAPDTPSSEQPPPSEQSARTELATLAVAPEGSMDDYGREEFPHWSSQGDSCDTREAVLKRDGSDVTTSSDCYPDTGRWYSTYDARWVADPSGIDIDHMVPLAEAWRSGADGWSTDRREAFANDLEHLQLLAVSDDANRAKSDSDPAQWKPPEQGTWCAYARKWISVKHTYELTIDTAEKTALTGMLGHCPSAAEEAPAQPPTREPGARDEPEMSGPDPETVYFENCDAARDADAAPVRRGDPGYGPHLDRDGDGTACEA